MKHNIKVTIILLLLFICSHLIGLYVINHYLPSTADLPLNIEKPQFAEETSYLPIFLTIIIATALALLLIRFKALKIWKFWFLLSVFMTLTIAFNAFIPEAFAITLAIIFALWKIFKPNVFAGLLVPYSDNKIINKYKKAPENSKVSKVRVSEAMLGGGDIGFPLLFSGVILKTLGLNQALIVSLCSALALLFLFIIAEKKKFYPAMPFITAGCLIGYAIVY